MIGCRVDYIRDNVYFFVLCFMVSMGVFESNIWEIILWLGYLLRLIGELVNIICKLDDSEEDYLN